MASANTSSPAGHTAPAPGKLGTFAGVFTPSILTILGLVLFLRLGFVIGGTGLERALVIIAIANVISLLTSFSVAAITSNLRVKGGGDYYLISRTLGLGYGGAIGLVLFLAQSISIGFYCVGFAEVVGTMLPHADPALQRMYGGAAVLGLGVLAWLGSDWATRFQYVVMAVIGTGLALFAAGAASSWSGSLLAASWDRPADGLAFGVAFAIFFPAVTGFTQGISMSGDLADPSRSIPRGVFAAVALSIAVYVGCAVLLAASVDSAGLRGDYLAMKQVTVFAPVIDAAVIAATLSSALSSFLGAPRILQSLAQDGVLPAARPFATGSGPANNPRRAVLLAGAIAAGVVVLGDLNLIASVVSMFFLISYGLLNYATFYEARSESPSFRPTFRYYHPVVGLVGAVACLAAMLVIDLPAGIASAAIVFGVYQYLEFRAPPARFADSRRSHHLHEARRHLLAAAAEDERARDWRPQLLVFSDSSQRRGRLLQFAAWIEGGTGLTTVVRVIEGHGRAAEDRRQEALAELAEDIEQGPFNAFPLAVVGEDLDATIAALVQSAGVGPVRANTVMVNWSAGPVSLARPLGTERFTRNLRTAFGLGHNLLILDVDAAEWDSLGRVEDGHRVIDVWWRPNKTGELMLLLAHLVTRSRDWHDATVRVLAEPAPKQSAEELSEELAAMLAEYRIDAEVVPAPVEAGSILEHSGDSSLVFLPFAIHGARFYGPTGDELTSFLDGLPVVVLALAAQDVDLAGDPDSEAEGEADEDPGDSPDAKPPET